MFRWTLKQAKHSRPSCGWGWNLEEFIATSTRSAANRWRPRKSINKARPDLMPAFLFWFDVLYDFVLFCSIIDEEVFVPGKRFAPLAKFGLSSCQRRWRFAEASATVWTVSAFRAIAGVSFSAYQRQVMGWSVGNWAVIDFSCQACTVLGVRLLNQYCQSGTDTTVCSQSSMESGREWTPASALYGQSLSWNAGGK